MWARHSGPRPVIPALRGGGSRTGGRGGTAERPVTQYIQGQPKLHTEILSPKQTQKSQPIRFTLFPVLNQSRELRQSRVSERGKTPKVTEQTLMVCVFKVVSSGAQTQVNDEEL